MIQKCESPAKPGGIKSYTLKHQRNQSEFRTPIIVRNASMEGPILHGSASRQMPQLGGRYSNLRQSFQHKTSKILTMEELRGLKRPLGGAMNASGEHKLPLARRPTQTPSARSLQPVVYQPNGLSRVPPSVL